MRFTLWAFAVGSQLARIVFAFTNGTLLPAYLCNDPDGYPKSAGTLIPFLQLGTAADNYNQFPPGNATTPIIAFGDNVVTNVTAIAPTARQIIGAFHNGGAQQNASGVTVTPVEYEKSTVNPIWLAPLNSDPASGNGSYTITPGAIHSFVVAAHCPSPDPRGYNNLGVALDGLFLYAVDTATNERIGSWVNVGPTLTNWYACNPKMTSSVSVGIVHDQLASGNSNIANLTWQAPSAIQGTVKFIGAGVSDCAFGPVAITFNTTTNLTAPSATSQGLTVNLLAATDATNNLSPYVLKDAAADLPQTVPVTPTAAPTIAPTVATTAAPTAAAAHTAASVLNSTVSGTIAVAVGFGGAIFGGLVVGLSCLLINRRRRTNAREPLLMNS